MRKFVVFLSIFFMSILFSSEKTSAYVTPTDRPEDDLSAYFVVDEVVDYGLRNQTNDYYISVYDLKGNFIGGNYYKNLKITNRNSNRKLKLADNTDYVAKIEGEGIQTRYQVFQVKYLTEKSILADAGKLHVFTDYSRIIRSYNNSHYDDIFKHDIELIKDGRVIASKNNAVDYSFEVINGPYTINFGDLYEFNIKVNPAQQIDFYPYVPQNEMRLYPDLPYDNTVKIFDEEGYNVQTVTTAGGIEINAGKYMMHYNEERLPLIVDDMVSMRKLNFRDVYGFVPGVKFDIRHENDSKKITAPVQMTVTAEDGTVVAKYRDYKKDLIELPYAGRYTVKLDVSGYYSQEKTFTYNGELELIEATLYLEEKSEAVFVELLNPTNVNKTSAQIELVNNKTGKVLYGINGTGYDTWTVDGVEPGVYTLRFKASGHVTFEQEVVVYKSSQITVPVFLTTYHPWYDRFEKFDDVKVVDKNKQWQVKFSAPINAKLLSTDNIYVTDGNGVRLNDITLRLSDDKKTVTVSRKSDYVSGAKYVLYISSQLKSSNNKRAKDTKLEFVIE